MEDMIVGRLSEKGQNEIDLQMEKISEENEDPYAHEPLRHKSLIVHSDQPMNAEVPDNLITDSYITPADKFYIRHHHPVPLLSQKDIENYELEIDLSEFFVRNSSSFKISLADIKKLPKVEVTATLQCSGNRRGDMNSHKRTSGTSWGQGAISTATWGGARLVDVLRLAGLEDPYTLAEMNGTEKHVRFESLDGMKASIGLEKATSPYGDVIVAYEMNHEPLTRDHGFPLRIIVPGYCAVRNVKWLKKIEVSGCEAEGAW
jgi:sulfite oxidase